mmetsp:Transcript_39717/g.81681  ORF Transcript_39717/g.81681 Transcript_39717/m.81681 type:complete len:302 (-) Transcript_39717:96-1001(-)
MKSILKDSCSRRIVESVGSAIASLEEARSGLHGDSTNAGYTLANCLHKYRDALTESFSTTVEEEAAYDKNLRLQQERYQILLTEESEQNKEIESHRMQEAQVVCKMESELSKLKVECKELTRENAEENLAKDSCQEEKRKEAEIVHRQRVEHLLSSKLQLQNQLAGFSLDYKTKEQEIETTKQELEDRLLQEWNTHCANMADAADESKALTDKMKVECEENQTLSRHFDLVDQNLRRKREEEAIIQSILDKEEAAEEMLQHGARQLQRLFRAKVMAKKRSKKAEGGKNRKKNKKSNRKKKR